MQAGGRLVQDIERVAGGAAGEFGGQFDALGFAAGQRGRRLAQMDIAQADIVQGLQLVLDGGDIGEEFQRFFHGHIQDIGDRFAPVADVQRLPVIALAVADFAGDIDIRQELHFDLDDAVALAGFAAPALDIEGEAAGPVAAGAGLRGLGEELADHVEDAGIGGGVGARACGRWATGRCR